MTILKIDFVNNGVEGTRYIQLRFDLKVEKIHLNDQVKTLTCFNGCSHDEKTGIISYLSPYGRKERVCHELELI